MYNILALMTGALFWGVGDRYDFELVQPRASLRFYCVASFILINIVVVPFTVTERTIVD